MQPFPQMAPSATELFATRIKFGKFFPGLQTFNKFIQSRVTSPPQPFNSTSRVPHRLVRDRFRLLNRHIRTEGEFLR